MITVIDCFLAINEQPEEFPTYKAIDCNLHVNENDENFFGRIIDCSLMVQRALVGACLATAQSIRLKITVDGEDVSAALVGQMMIQHNENIISIFSFNLGDFQYSPLINNHIAEDKEVIITVYVNGQEIKLFTGLVDGTRSDFTCGKYNLNIYGSDYGKKLLKRMTLISVQEAATAKTRGAIIRYLANQAGITNIDVPTGSKTKIDHSFQDQFIWDMIQKEMMIEGWYLRFNEEGVMQVKLKQPKTNKSKYPQADWTYHEGEFIELGLDGTDKDVINRVIILGAIFEDEITNVVKGEEIQQVEVPQEEYKDTSFSFSKSFSQGEKVTTWSEGTSEIKISARYVGSIKTGIGWVTDQEYEFKISGTLSGKIKSTNWSVSGKATKIWSSKIKCRVAREVIYGSGVSWAQERAFSISVSVKVTELVAGGSIWTEETIPNETIETKIVYTQVKASCFDKNSIAFYGERKPNEEGALNYPLAETEGQCRRVGENIILDSHRFTKQPDELVAFNPKLVIGDTLELYDTKIGYNGERWLAEEVIHTIDVDRKGAIKARTRVGCVFYA